MQFISRNKALVILWYSGLLLIALWSWVLVDPNFTLVTHADWTQFREHAISIGYFQRTLSASVYVGLIIALSVCSWALVRWYRGPIAPLAIGAGVIAGLLSYPSLSHDLFNYIFDARIFTHYGQNPYLFRALDFPSDPMVRFMHWVHRTYPYGPTYLLMSFIPSLLGMGKFPLTFFLFRLWHVVLFVVTAIALSRIHKTIALLFTTAPLVIVEGLVNTHNDFIAVALALIGIVYIIERRHTKTKEANKHNHNHWLLAGLLFFLSGGIKYITIPVILLWIAPHTLEMGWRDKKGSVHRVGLQSWQLVMVGLLLILCVLITTMEIQPWYFLNLFILLPFIPKIFSNAQLFFMGLLLSYYPYVIGGEWGQGGDVGMKRAIIVVAFILNAIVLFFGHLIHMYKRKTHTL